MSQRKQIKVLLYAINGLGLGHLTRLTSIARDLNRLTDALELRADIRFLTTSEADWLSRDFPTYKLPSKSVFKARGLAGYAAQSKFFISNLVASFKPDLLVMDTQPEGSFQEFFFLRDYAARSVFIDRHKDQSQALSPSHQSHLELYDLILVPDHEQNAQEYPVPDSCQGRRHFVGPVSAYEAEYQSQQLRDYFGFKQPWPVVYLSAGGGGDKQLQTQMETLIDALESQDCYILAGYGPLYQGPKRYGAHLIPLTETQISRWFGGVDYAISAAGYNSYQELLAAGVPTLFYAQSRGLDRQDLRIESGLKQRWHESLEDFTPESILKGFKRLQAKGSEICEQLQQRPAPLGSCYAAYEILKLHASLPGSPVDKTQLTLAADELIQSSRPFQSEHFRWRRYLNQHLLSERERQRLSEAAMLNILTSRSISHRAIPKQQTQAPLLLLINALMQLRLRMDISEKQLQSLIRLWLPKPESEPLLELAETLTQLAQQDLSVLLLESWLRFAARLYPDSQIRCALTLKMIQSGQFKQHLEWLMQADPAEILPYFAHFAEAP